MGDWEISGPYVPNDESEFRGVDFDFGRPSMDDGTWTSSEGYGAGTSGAAYILLPTGITLGTAGTINTNSITEPYSSAHPELGGFEPADPDNNPETTQYYSRKGTSAFSGEGMRGGDAVRSDDGDIVGEAQQAVQFETEDAETAIETSTMGIGFMNLTTSDNSGHHTGKLFFNYSKINSEPTYAVTVDNVSKEPTLRQFYVENPFYYSEDESAGLQYKFGWDPTYAVEGSLYGQLQGVLRQSLTNIIDLLNTTYPVNYATFPRTPPYKVRPNIISAIPGIEAEMSAPSGLTVPLDQATDLEVFIASGTPEIATGLGMSEMGIADSSGGEYE